MDRVETISAVVHNRFRLNFARNYDIGLFKYLGRREIWPRPNFDLLSFAVNRKWTTVRAAITHTPSRTLSYLEIITPDDPKKIPLSIVMRLYVI